ncbi:MAG: hypothetical protein K6B43_10675 [Treponema sp.]|nr:hypothetical protein [Treponema sp.]
MKKSVLVGALMAFASAFLATAEVPSELKAEMIKEDKAAVFFDASDYGKNYSEIQMLNKTAEKIEMTIYAYNPKLEKNSTKPIGWFKFGTTKVKDYNDLDTMSKAIKYKVTSIKEFRYFAYSTSKTVREVKFNLDYDKEAFTVRADYVNKVRPLASVEVKPVLAKNPSNKKDILGVKGEISLRNISDKTIKNITLTIKASDKSLVSRTNDGKEEAIYHIGELIEDGEKYKAETPVFWNNTAIDEIRVTKVKILYLDSTEDEYEI